MGVRDLYADGSVAKSDQITLNGDQVFFKGKSISGLSVKVAGTKMSDVYLMKNAFSSSNKLCMVMGHEYLHAGFDFIRHTNGIKQHEAIYKWEAINARYSPEFFEGIYHSVYCIPTLLITINQSSPMRNKVYTSPVFVVILLL
jgi:hypothetical protein